MIWSPTIRKPAGSCCGVMITDRLTAGLVRVTHHGSRVSAGVGKERHGGQDHWLLGLRAREISTEQEAGCLGHQVRPPIGDIDKLGDGLGPRTVLSGVAASDRR